MYVNVVPCYLRNSMDNAFKKMNRGCMTLLLVVKAGSRLRARHAIPRFSFKCLFRSRLSLERERTTHTNPPSAPALFSKDFPTKCRDFRDPYLHLAEILKKSWGFLKIKLFVHFGVDVIFLVLWNRKKEACFQYSVMVWNYIIKGQFIVFH